MDELIRSYKESVLLEEGACASLDAEVVRQRQLAENASAPYLAEAKRLEEQRAIVAAPYRALQTEYLAEIEPAIIEHGKTYKCAAGTVKFRKAALRVSYDWRKVDTVKAMLTDLLPSLAAELQAARSESAGAPSFSIE